jgi:glycosyltransferase involved in cell wall biosynthesis
MHAPISVIIPCYRASSFLERAVISVISQTLLPKELILIDDASPDGGKTKAMIEQLKEYALKKNIGISVSSIYLDVNVGPGGARNFGWSKATQPWIAFLDADDAWLSDKLRIQWEWISNQPDAQLVGHLHHEYHEGMGKALVSKDVIASRIYFGQMLVANRFYTRTVMLRKDLPFRFQNGDFTEDYLLWLEIILAGYPAFVINQDLSVSFRPEYSVGGYSGQLWIHEKRELRAWIFLYQAKKISLFTLAIALSWSYLKYLRRVIKSCRI